MTKRTANTPDHGKCFEEIACESAENFVQCLRPTHPRWSGETLVSEWLFRGQSDSSWELIPSAWRSFGSSDNHGWSGQLQLLIEQGTRWKNILFSWDDVDKNTFGLERPLFDEWKKLSEDIKRERIQEFIAQTAFEFQVIHDFWVLADDVGHPVEAPGWLAYSVQSFVGSSRGGPSEKLFEQVLVATAQHHGIPTRLLDWTLNPLTAAFFATDRIDAEKTKQVAVWAIRGDAVKRSRLREYSVPRHLLPFLHAQAGLFTWDPLASVDFALTGCWPCQRQALEELHSRHNGPHPKRPWIFKFVLPAQEATVVAEMLFKERLSRSHLMPTLDNVTRTLSSSLKWRRPGSLLD